MGPPYLVNMIWDFQMASAI